MIKSKGRPRYRTGSIVKLLNGSGTGKVISSYYNQFTGWEYELSIGGVKMYVRESDIYREGDQTYHGK